MRNSKLWVSGCLVLIGIVTGAGMAGAAEEPALNVVLPVSVPILDSGDTNATQVQTAAPAPVPEKQVEAPVPAPEATNALPTVVHPPVHPVDTNVVTAPPVVSVVAPVVVAPAEAEAVMTGAEAWRATDWQIGTRYTEFQLQDKQRGTPGNGSFFGTITEITEVQGGAPDKAYLQYRLFRSPFWIGVSYDHVEARTQDNVDTDGDGVYDLKGSDGNEEIQGFIPYLQAAWDNSTRFTPFVQLGYAFYQAEFMPNSWGANHQRFVESSSSVNGLELAGGLNIRLYKNLSADLFAKTVQVDDITGKWYYAYGYFEGGDFIMTMSYTAFGGGLNWRF